MASTREQLLTAVAVVENRDFDAHLRTCDVDAVKEPDKVPSDLICVGCIFMVLVVMVFSPRLGERQMRLQMVLK